MQNASASPTSIRFSSLSIISLVEEVFGVLQNGHFSSAIMLPRLSYTSAWQHPLQIIFPQHDLYRLPLSIVGRRRKQMGQSPCRGGGSLNNASSCFSATRLSHSFLCFDRCFFLQAALQYVDSLHLLQMFRLLPSLPQLAHTAISSCSFERSSIFFFETTFQILVPLRWMWLQSLMATHRWRHS